MKLKSSRILIAAGILLLAILVIIILPRAQAFWQTPLGPGLGFEEQPLPTFTNLPIPPTVPVETILPTLDATATPIPPTATLLPTSVPITPVSFATNTPSMSCGGESQMLILAVGLDNRVEGFSSYGRADVVKIVKVDFGTPSISVLSFPRDLWVNLPNTKEKTQSKLNQSYFYGMPEFDYYQGPGNSIGLLARTLAYNYGVQPDQYGIVNISILEDMIDAVGGIDIYLEQTLDARDSPESDDLWKIYEAGWNHLDGKRGVYYARIRKTDDVFGRMDRQAEILCALKTKLLSPQAIISIPEMISAFTGNVQTDLTPEQLSHLACIAPFLKPENITFARFPEYELHGTMIESPNLKGKEFIWDVDNNAIRNYVTLFLADSWPPPATEEPDSTHNGTTQMLCPEYPGQ